MEKKAPQWAHDVLDTLANIRHTGYLKECLIHHAPIEVLIKMAESIKDMKY